MICDNLSIIEVVFLMQFIIIPKKKSLQRNNDDIQLLIWKQTLRGMYKITNQLGLFFLPMKDSISSRVCNPAQFKQIRKLNE